MFTPEEVAQTEYSILLATKRVESFPSTRMLIHSLVEESGIQESLENFIRVTAARRVYAAQTIKMLRAKLKQSERFRVQLLLDKYFK